MIHHLTHINNLNNILTQGLKARNFINSFINTANQSIINGRQTISNYNLNNYVPFHLNYFQEEYGISYNFNVLNTYGRHNMIYLIFDFEELSTNLYCLYHPTSNFSKVLSSYSDYITKLNSEYASLSLQGRLNFTSNQVQQLLMSEILAYKDYPLTHLKEIRVYNSFAQSFVQTILNNHNMGHVIVNYNNKFFR